MMFYSKISLVNASYNILFNLENIDGETAKDLFKHGICWIHVKRNFVLCLTIE